MIKVKLVIQQVVSYITEASLSLGSLLFLITLSFQVSNSYLTSWLPKFSPFCLFVCFPEALRSSKILLASVSKCILHPTILHSLHPCFPLHHPFVFYAHAGCCSNTRHRWRHSITILSFPSDRWFGFWA